MAANSTPLSLFEILRRLFAATQPQAVDEAEIARTLDRLDSMARLLDSSFVIPGLNRRAGLDSLIGLIPGIGDFASGALSTYFVFEARRIGAPSSVLAKMAANIGIDAVIGVVPALGDLFDVAFKANMRNVALLRSHFAMDQAASARSRNAPAGNGPVIDLEAVRRS